MDTMDAMLAGGPTGQLLDGRYRITSTIAHGGMATVYLGVDTRLDRTVAIKIMHAELAADEDFVARFIREARSIAQLSHPNVVSVYDQGSDGHHLYLAMEYVRGRTLRELLTERGRLSPRESLDIIESVLAGLAAAHQGGIVHRDVKPENVLLAEDGRVKVADFGLARNMTGTSNHTKTGVLMGTVAYLAPEQVTESASDARCDVYAAGVVLFELLTGQQPHTGESALAVAYKHVNETVPPPSAVLPGLPHALDALVALATSRDPQLRPADAGQFLQAVGQVRHGLPISWPPPQPGPQFPPTQQLQPGQQFQAPPPPPPGQRFQPGADTRAPRHAAGASQQGTDQQGTSQHAPGQHAPGQHGAGQHGPGQHGPVQNTPGQYAPGQYAPGQYGAVPYGAEDFAGIAGQWGPPQGPQAGPQHGFASTAMGTQQTGGMYGAQHTLIVDRNGGEAPPREPRLQRWLFSRRLVYLLVLIVVIALVAGVGWYQLEGRYTHVPKVTGLSVTAAGAELRSMGFTVTTGPATMDDALAKGDVAATVPAPSSRVRKGSTIELIPSAGPKMISVPQVSGQALAAAQAALRQAGLTPGAVTSQVSATITAGVVISTNPAASTSWPQNKPVTILVSAGPPLPNFVGQQESAIQAWAQPNGIALNVQAAPNSSQPQGTIIRQSPAPNTPMTKGEVVTIYISPGPPAVSIPNVDGMGVGQAAKELTGLGFGVSVQQVGVFGHTVINYSPTGQAPKGTTITLYSGLSGL
jgi:eukaryotic-like serine/threonine-protein kinase